MKATAFEYAAPETVSEAVGLLREYGDDAKVLAGGQSLLAMMNLRVAQPEVLIDIGRCDLAGVTFDSDVRIAAMTIQNDVYHSPDIATEVPLLSQAMRYVSHHTVRNRGTVGGSAAHADPAAEIPAAMVALDATVEIHGPAGARDVPASDFFITHYTTAVQPDELLVAVRFPKRRWDRTAYYEVARRHGDYALAGAAVGLDLDDEGRISRARVVLSGAHERPVRAIDAEGSLEGTRGDDADGKAAGLAAVNNMDTVGDLHGSTRYRERLVAVVVARAVRAAMTGSATNNGVTPA